MVPLGQAQNPEMSRQSVMSSVSEGPGQEHFQSRFRGIWGSFRKRGNVKEKPKLWQTNCEKEVRKFKDDRKKKAFYVAKEMMSSEAVFVGVLRLLNVELQQFIQERRIESPEEIIPNADFQKIFADFLGLQAINEEILRDFEERIKNWDTSPKIADILVKKGPFLKLYYNYIRNFQNLNDHLDFCCKTYPKFQLLISEFEKKDICKSLKIPHFLLKPVQRLPQYRLLLQDYLKNLDQNDDDFENTVNALRVVEDVASKAESFIKNEENFHRLLKLQYQLGDYELLIPGRQLIKEGELKKMNRKGDDPRYFILLTDCLLYTISAESFISGGFSLKLRYEIPMASMEVKISNNVDDYQREFSINSPVRSCTLRAASVTERDDWIRALERAKRDFEIRSKSFQDLGKETSETDSQLKLGQLAPVWIQDKRVTMCQGCNVEFSLSLRRHHCRACGKVVCYFCSGNKAPLKYLNFEPARVCNTCYEKLREDYLNDDALAPLFRKKSTSQILVKHIPPRLQNSGLVDGAQIRGYLRRQTRHSWHWKKLWFVLKDRVLFTHRAPEDQVAIESIPILGFTLETSFKGGADQEVSGLMFRLSHQGSGAINFAAENPETRDRWIEALKKAIILDE